MVVHAVHAFRLAVSVNAGRIRIMDTAGSYAKECVDQRQPFELVIRQVGVNQLAKL